MWLASRLNPLKRFHFSNWKEERWSSSALRQLNMKESPTLQSKFLLRTTAESILQNHAMKNVNSHSAASYWIRTTNEQRAGRSLQRPVSHITQLVDRAAGWCNLVLLQRAAKQEITQQLRDTQHESTCHYIQVSSSTTTKKRGAKDDQRWGRRAWTDWWDVFISLLLLTGGRHQQQGDDRKRGQREVEPHMHRKIGRWLVP